MTKNMISMKKLVVLVIAFAMTATMFPATAKAASTNTTLYRKAKAAQQKLTGNAEYYGYYTEASLKSNSSTKVVYNLTYTNTKNRYFELTQTTVKSGSRIKTYYINVRKKEDGKISYNGMVKSLAKNKTQNGYAMMDKSSILADDLIEEAEKDGWTVSGVKSSAKASEGKTTFKAVNNNNQAYTIVVARRATKSKSVKTIYTMNGKTVTKEVIKKQLKKFA